MFLVVRVLSIATLFSFASITYQAFAENKNLVRVTKITYSNATWNTDSRKVDDASIVFRDKTSGKILQIQLEETEPDSAEFTGQFSVNLGEQMAPEVYIPPKELRATDKDNKKLHELIQKGKLQRKPTIWIKDRKGQSVLAVYNTTPEAEAALKAYESERLARGSHNGAVAPGETAATLAAAKATTDRAQLELVERQKAEERERQSQAMSAKERAARQEKAKELYSKGMAEFNKGDFKAAEELFKSAVSLDPANKDYYYTYGIALYRNEKFTEAAVALKLAKVDPAREKERKYYEGLVHYRLKELDQALNDFKEVAATEDKNLAPSATFYSGLILFSQEKYDPAKGMFEKVIDTSSDPALDKQSEEYIDRIAGALVFQKMRENKWTLSSTIGLMYDSNVLLSPDGATSSATNISDARLMTLFDLQYRPIFNEKHEWAPHLTANLTNSAKNAAASADPYIFTVAAPYTYKGVWGKKQLRQTFNPGYEILYLDPYATGTKVNEQTSYYLGSDTMLVMSPTWISTYSLELRSDDSTDVASLGDGDMDSTKITLRTTQVKVLDKKAMLMPMLSYALNKARGKDKTYGRYDLGLTYAAPFWKDSTWNAGLTYYNMKYPDATTKRTDTNYTLAAGFSKPVREWVSWGVSGTYTKNKSDIPSNTYTKYMIVTTATFTTNF